MKALDFLIYRARYTAEIVGPVVLLLLSALFLYSGALFSESVPKFYSSSEELLGQVLLMILTPAFLATYLVVAQRRSLRFADRPGASHPVSFEPPDWLQKIAGRTVFFGGLVGFLFGLLFNFLTELRDSL